MSVDEILAELVAMSGAVAVAVIDYENAMVLATRSKHDDFDMEIWDIIAADATNVIGAIDKAINLMEVEDEVVSVLFTLKDEYYLVYPARHVENTIVYLIADRHVANLSVCRRLLARAVSLLGM